MDARAVAARYFDAWNRHDPEAVAAAFVEDGTYVDPGVPAGIGPGETAEHAARLFAGFGDLAFAVEEQSDDGSGTVFARWRMTGTNRGPFGGGAPTGRSVDLPGVDLIRVEGDRLRSVEGFFDTGAIPRQLGLQVIVQPTTIGPFGFGTSTYAARSGAEPGAVSLTVLQARSPEEQKTVRAYSRDTVLGLLDTPGFISWVAATVGDRMYTITAWEGVDDPARIRRNGPHAEAMRRFFASGEEALAAGGQTGVWAPHRLNGLWVRCTACGEMERAVEDGPCRCGAALPPAPAYW